MRAHTRASWSFTISGEFCDTRRGVVQLSGPLRARAFWGLNVSSGSLERLQSKPPSVGERSSSGTQEETEVSRAFSWCSAYADRRRTPPNLRRSASVPPCQISGTTFESKRSKTLVGARGFEPPTPSPPVRRREFPGIALLWINSPKPLVNQGSSNYPVS